MAAPVAPLGSSMWEPSRETLSHIKSWALLLKHVGLGDEPGQALLDCLGIETDDDFAVLADVKVATVDADVADWQWKDAEGFVRKPKSKHQGQLGIRLRYATILAGTTRSANDVVMSPLTQPTLPSSPTPTPQVEPETIDKSVITMDTGTDKAKGVDDKPLMKEAVEDDEADTDDEGIRTSPNCSGRRYRP